MSLRLRLLIAVVFSRIDMLFQNCSVYALPCWCKPYPFAKYETFGPSIYLLLCPLLCQFLSLVLFDCYLLFIYCSLYCSSCTAASSAARSDSSRCLCRSCNRTTCSLASPMALIAATWTPSRASSCARFKQRQHCATCVAVCLWGIGRNAKNYDHFAWWHPWVTHRNW